MIAETIVAVLMVCSGLAALAAALGLLRLRDFFLRMHAPAICYTLGTWTSCLASVVYFSSGDRHIAPHAWLIVVVLSITTPVTTVLLARAGLFRARQAGEAVPGPLLGSAEAEREKT